MEYLRGDEEVSFQNLHPAAQLFSARLPGVTVNPSDTPIMTERIPRRPHRLVRSTSSSRKHC